MERILAHSILYEGREYRMCVAELQPDGTVTFTPFDSEVHSTVFVSGRVRLTVEGSALRCTPIENHGDDAV